jgi:hypothetical protein
LKPQSRALIAPVRVIEHGSRVVEEGSRVIEDGSRVIEDGSRTIEHGSRAIEHGSRAIEHGSHVIEDGSRATGSVVRRVRIADLLRIGPRCGPSAPHFRVAFLRKKSDDGKNLPESGMSPSYDLRPDYVRD